MMFLLSDVDIWSLYLLALNVLLAFFVGFFARDHYYRRPLMVPLPPPGMRVSDRAELRAPLPVFEPGLVPPVPAAQERQEAPLVKNKVSKVEDLLGY